MPNILLIVGLLAAAPMPEDALIVSAHIDARALRLGREYEIVLDIRVKEGLSSSAAGIQAPILQIAVPPSVKLTGKVLKTYKQLSRNEFLQEPFERLVPDSPARIGFKLRRKPSADDQFGLNILAYVGSKSGDESWFVRRRLTLPLIPNASAVAAAPDVSDWGKEDLLQIGEPAAAFSLPTADGSTVTLDQYLGKKNIIVTTYRAYW